MNNTSLRIGMVGLGRLGQRHAENLVRRVAHTQVVAACSPVAEELAWASAKMGVRKVYTNYGALMACTEMDVVFMVKNR